MNMPSTAQLDNWCILHHIDVRICATSVTLTAYNPNDPADVIERVKADDVSLGNHLRYLNACDEMAVKLCALKPSVIHFLNHEAAEPHPD